MFNLLPVQTKKYLKTEYRLRLAITYLVFLAVLGIAATALLVPSYIYSNLKLKAAIIERDLVKKRNADSVNSETASILVNTKKKLELAKPSDKQFLSHLLIRVIGLRGSGVTFNSISVSSSQTERTLTLSGFAKTRNDLIEFYKRFDDDKAFSKINLPISSYAKDKDINFNVTFTTKI